MTTENVTEQALRRWVADPASDDVDTERHILSCSACRARIATLVGTGRPASDGSAASSGRDPATRDAARTGLPDLAVVWGRVRDEVEVPKPSPFERLLARVGLPAHEARLVAAAPAFQAAWLGGVLVVGFFVVVAAQIAYGPGQTVLLSVAPLLPSLAVAVSYDPDVQPALEQEVATPYPASRLVLLRTVAVLAGAVPAVIIFGLLVPGPPAYLWLLPAIGFVAVVLACSTWVNPLRAVAGIAAGWFLTVSLASRGGPASDVLSDWYQLAYLCLAVTSMVVFLARGRHLRSDGGWQ